MKEYRPDYFQFWINQKEALIRLYVSNLHLKKHFTLNNAFVANIHDGVSFQYIDLTLLTWEFLRSLQFQFGRLHVCIEEGT